MVDLDWSALGFAYRKTAGNVRCHFRDGQWSLPQLFTEDTINLSIAAVALHYGQSVFEGLKVFAGADGRAYALRPEQNARRLNASLRYLVMPEIPEETFLAALKMLVRANADFVPPADTGASLYVRPVVFGSSAKMGVGPATEYDMIMMAMPVGAYYKDGLHSVDAVIYDDSDRAAPFGTGHIKAAGNYAASLLAGERSHAEGFPITLYLDAATRTKIEEFSSSNFIGITRDKHYITPDSHSVLPSITNDSLRTLAREAGLVVEQRPILESELADLSEVAACGTAVVITPVHRIVHGAKTYEYARGCGPVCQMLYERYTAIQHGTVPDTHNWLMPMN